MEVRTCLKVLVLVFLPNTVVTGQDPEPSPVIIDTDIGGGIDDALALAAAIMSPELEIRGITIGGSDAGTRARIAGRFLENTAHPRIPVAIGSSDESGTPIDGQRQFARRAGFRGPTRDNAIEFMYEQLKKDPGKITIICLGPPTNVADLIERHPEAKPWIRNLIVWTDQIGDTLAKIREANIPLHGVLPGTITPRLTEPMRKRLFASCTPLSYNLRSLAELSGEDGPSLRGACMIQLVRSPDEPVSTAHSGTDSRQSRDPDRVIDRITSPSPNPRYMPNHVPIVIGGGDYHRLCGYPIEERQIRGLLEELAESLGKPGTIELRVEPDSDEAALDRVAKLCRVAGWTDQRVTLVKRTVSRPIDRKGLPHRVHVFEDYETEIERRWWLAGEPITENLPSGSTRAIRAMPCRNFDGKMGDFYRPYRAVIFNPVPGPPMGPCTRLGFRYHLTGTDRVRVQIYSLSNGYHRSLTLTGLSQGAWHSATVDLTEARRPDGSGGPLAKDERIDDIQFYIDPEGELLIDDIVLYDEAPENERRPFPKQTVFTGWFDTGKQGSEWPGDFEVVRHEPPQGWNFTQSVPNEKTKAPWIRVHLRGRRPLAEQVRAQFRYRIKDSARLTAELYDSQTGSVWKQVVDDLIPNEWVCAEAVFDLSSILEEKRFGDEIRFHVDPGCELQIDDLLLYVPEISRRENP